MRRKHIEMRGVPRAVWLVPAGTLAWVIAAAGAGCGSSADPAAQSANGTSSVGSTSAGTSGSGGSLGLGGGSGDGVGSGSGSSMIDPDAACATGSAEATLVALSMLVMFDKSGSMNDDGKWPSATSAMKAFLTDPGSAGLRIALRFFPHDSPVSGCNDTDCSVDACSAPLVPIAPVTAEPAPADAQELALVSAIDGNAPGGGGGTPLYAALGGAEQWALAYAASAAHATEKVVVVLVTDGLPNGCDENIADIAGLAANAYASGVLTYAVGLQGSSEAQMDQIAQAGGTTKGYFIGNGNAEADLLAAMKAIQGKNLSCSFALPKSMDPSKPTDSAKVNVSYTPGAGSTVTLGKVVDASSCGPSGGWYYDDNAAPTTITLCPVTCSGVQADAAAKIEILMGCASVIGIPK